MIASQHTRMTIDKSRLSNAPVPELSLDNAQEGNHQRPEQHHSKDMSMSRINVNNADVEKYSDNANNATAGIPTIPDRDQRLGITQIATADNNPPHKLMEGNETNANASLIVIGGSTLTLTCSTKEETHEGAKQVHKIQNDTCTKNDAMATIPRTIELCNESMPPTSQTQAQTQSQTQTHTGSSSASAIMPYLGGLAQQHSFLPSSPTAACTTKLSTGTIVTAHNGNVPPHKGLINLGNTCYLNSALQMLMSIDDFVTEIIDIYENDSASKKRATIEKSDGMCTAMAVEINTDRHASMDSPQIAMRIEGTKGYPLRDALAQFFLSARHTRNNGTDDEDEAFKCNHLCNAVDPTHLKSIIDEKTSLFAGSLQQDSHEFLSTILDLLRDEIVEQEERIAQQIVNDGNDAQSQETHPAENTNSTDRVEGQEDKVILQDRTDTGATMSTLEVVADGFVMIEKEDTLETEETAAREKAIKKPREDKSRSIAKARSFSELNLEGVQTLLHGEKQISLGNKGTLSDTHWSALETSTSDLQCKLVGGRIAVIAPEPKVQQSEQSDEHAIESSDKPGESESSNNTNSNDGQAVETNNSDGPVPAKPLWTDNVVDNFFTMAVRTHLTCDSCKYTRSHEEVFRHLSIEIAAVDEGNEIESCQERSIQEGLRKFFQEEKRELKCEKCFFESATQSSEIIKLPKSLIVHLKRFIVDVSADYTSISYRKNRAAIEFGERISLQEDDHDGILGAVLANDVTYPKKRKRQISSHSYDDAMSCSDDDFEAMSIASEQSYIGVSQKDHYYHIRSVVNHIGESAQCGHYTADAYKIYRKEPEREGGLHDRKWTRFNDAFVTQIDELGRGSQETAYMIMYEFDG